MWLTKNTAPAQRSTQRSTSYGSGVAAAVTAACAAYFLDPESGRRRRALLRDQANRLMHDAREFLGKANRDARQRARGLYEESTSRFRSGTTDDHTLEERIRAELGRLSAHPGAIEVLCSDGTARLKGDILEDEVAVVMRGVGRVRGVKEVVNEMQVHGDGSHVPALQGGSTTTRQPRHEYLQENWSPAPRLLAGVAGFTMIAGGLGRRSMAGLGIATGGAALLARSICNMPLSRFVGLGARAQEGILVQKTIHVYAELDEAYACWRALEHFPEFMSHVREVRKIDDRHYHWTVDGPAGIPVEWDAEITADVPGELIAWRTVKDSAVQSTGVVQFEPSSYGGTRVHIRMSYRPPAHAVGHTIAKVFGRDPKRQIDADLLRFKSFVETGRTTGRQGTVTRH